MTLWVVKGGRGGEREDRFLERALVGIGWPDVPDLSAFHDRDALKTVYREVYPTDSEGKLNVQAGQLWAFARSMAVGDHVVVPLKRRGHIAIGRIASDYRYDPASEADMRHVRDVEWLASDIARTAFDKDLLYSFGSAQTVSTASRNNAEQRVLAMLRKGPGVAVPPPPGPDAVVEDVATRDLEQDGRDQIIDFIRSRFKGHDFARIVDAVLRAQGFATRVSPPGADGGVDILAGRGVLGFDEPRIVVQVKSQQSPADVSVLRELKGTMSDFGAEQGLLVCWGGFKDTLLREARNGYFKIRLWDQDALLTALFSNYETLDEELRAELPLKRIWSLAREADEQG